jgi:hypothetical protein
MLVFESFITVNKIPDFDVDFFYDSIQSCD